MDPQKIIQELESASQEWRYEINAERLAGNIVKEHYAKGAVMGLEIALGEIRRSVEVLPNHRIGPTEK